MKINLIASLNGALIGLSYGSEREITLGRDLSNTISPIVADGVSRNHAKIYAKNGDWYVEDVGSTNGTYVGNGRIAGPTKLVAKQKLQFGRFEMSVDEILTDDSAVPKAHSAAAAAPAVSEQAAPAAAPTVKTLTPANIHKPVVGGVKPLAGGVKPLAAAANPAVKLPAKPSPLGAGIKPLPRPVLKPAASAPAAVGMTPVE